MSRSEVIARFKGISLSQMDSVKLMNRTDRKYWFNVNHLEGLLLDIVDDYYVLEIEGGRNLPYSTTYYDTWGDHMYMTHHRGKLNRFKIRRRNYVTTDSSFLEIKFKSNKGRTIKKRIPTDYRNPHFNESEGVFVADKSPYRVEELHPVLVNGFRRLMLVSKSMNERVTIDQDLAFMSNGVEAKLSELVVVEVKSEGRAKSAIIDAMHSRRLKASGFSKYCMGRSITDQKLKHNLFKFKHRMIERHIERPLESVVSKA
ncbi:MAG: polyphosphate polymerase domain-containing protein [Rikenellaceae bacterium]